MGEWREEWMGEWSEEQVGVRGRRPGYREWPRREEMGRGRELARDTVGHERFAWCSSRVHLISGEPFIFTAYVRFMRDRPSAVNHSHVETGNMERPRRTPGLSRIGANSATPGEPPARTTKRRAAQLAGALSLSLLAVSIAACSSSVRSASPTPGRSGTKNVAWSAGFEPADYTGITGSLAASGSTFQQNYDQAAIRTLASVLPKIKVAYAGGGSGQGKTDLASGVVDWAGTDSLIKPEDVSKYAGKILYFPTVVAPITVSYNLRAVSKVNLDGPVLAKIFSTTITKWNDPAIKALNSGVRLPDTPVTVCHRSDSSGTTTNFSKFLADAGGADWTLGSSDTLNWAPTTHGGNGNGGVAQCINGKSGAIGYVDLSDAKSQQLTFASIKNKAGEYVQPTLKGASKAAAGAAVAPDLTYSPIDTAGSGVYPITSPTWIITLATQKDHAKATALKTFLHFVLTDGQDASFTASINYAPLPMALAAKALAQLDELSVR